MKNIRTILFLAFVALYFSGIMAGSVAQIKNSKQGEMYSYLDNAVSEYASTAPESVKRAFFDNAKIMPVLAVGGMFKAGAALLAGMLFVKGYAAGFSMTAVLRLYGIKGLILCGANIASILLFVPFVAYYGSYSSYYLPRYLPERKKWLKKYLSAFIILLLVLCTDAAARGFLSNVFINIFSGFLKTS